MYNFFTTELHGGFHRVHEVLCVTLCFNSVFSVVLNCCLMYRTYKRVTQRRSIALFQPSTKNYKLLNYKLQTSTQLLLPGRSRMPS